MRIRHLLPALLLTLPVAAIAQNDPMHDPMPTGNQAPSPASPGVQRPGPDSSQTGSGGADAQAMRDRIFLRKAAQGGMTEIRLSQLATQKSSSEDVKKFAQKMVDDHTALNDSLSAFNEQLGIRPSKAPNKMETLDLDRLTGLSGEDFDREYLTLMVQDHHRDLRDFREEAMVTSDPDLRDAVSKGQTLIAEHTRRVDKLAAAHGVPHP